MLYYCLGFRSFSRFLVSKGVSCEKAFHGEGKCSQSSFRTHVVLLAFRFQIFLHVFKYLQVKIYRVKKLFIENASCL